MIITIIVLMFIIIALLISLGMQMDKTLLIRQRYEAELHRNEVLSGKLADLSVPNENVDCTPVIDFEELGAFSVEREPNSGKVIIGYFLETDEGTKVKEWALYGLSNEQYRDLLADYRLYLAGKP